MLRRDLEDTDLIADALHRVACAEEVLGIYDSARAHQFDALALCEPLPELRADILHHLGVLSGVDADFAQAESYLLASLELRRNLHDRWGEAWSLTVLGNHYRSVANIEQSTDCYRRALDLYRSQRDRRRIAATLISMADLDIYQRQFEQARTHLGEATDIVYELGYLRGVAEVLESWAMMSASERQWRRFFVLGGAAAQLREEIGAVRASQAEEWIKGQERRAEVSATERLDWDMEGRRLGPAAAVGFAMRVG